MKRVSYSIPYNVDRNIGVAYNDQLERLPDDDDFALFLDGDATFTTVRFGHQIRGVVDRYPGCGYFVCHTNRVGCPWQVAAGVDRRSNDMGYHRRFGQALAELNGTVCADVTSFLPPASGVLLLVQKRVWRLAGGFRPTGMLGVDWDMFRRVQQRREQILLMRGVYVYHWYRGDDPGDVSHLVGPPAGTALQAGAGDLTAVPARVVTPTRPPLGQVPSGPLTPE